MYNNLSAAYKNLYIESWYCLCNFVVCSRFKKNVWFLFLKPINDVYVTYMTYNNETCSKRTLDYLI